MRISSGQTEKDTHDIVLYFQREMEIKDDVILKVCWLIIMMTIMTMYDDNFDKTICVNINPEDDVMTLMICYLT